MTYTPQCRHGQPGAFAALGIEPQPIHALCGSSGKLLPTDHLTRFRVTSPDPNPDIYLPALHHVSIHIPERHRRKYYERKMARSGMYHHPKLSALGPANLANRLSASELIQAYVDAELLQSPLDFAISILFSNPELASNRPHTAAIVTGDHIYPSEIINPAQYNRVRELATIISRQGQASSTGGWATITDSVDKDGNPLYFEFDLAERKVGDRVLEYKWSEMTTDVATVPNVGAMRTASEHQGNSGSSIVTVYQAYASRVKGLELATPQFKWTVKELAPNHGLGVDAGSLKFHAYGTFSIEVKNAYLRSLSAFAQFLTRKASKLKIRLAGKRSFRNLCEAGSRRIPKNLLRRSRRSTR
ncbi:hypothetical protein PAALTS15_20393 [Paenibacillus alvei TS-15]|uniref:Uncharacterized protein n=1 Tax=Paenibacillus alvei TS-15 TaxID=1117108 RepID=S9TSL1_PAEAL|nr:hypothetical protein [Paenibacillus alvei]EPY05291.1 hypothetical protein PAALTS15_20393 [Paenibacillus alvei TS-15]